MQNAVELTDFKTENQLLRCEVNQLKLALKQAKIEIEKLTNEKKNIVRT